MSFDTLRVEGSAPTMSAEEMAVRKQLFPRPEPKVRIYPHAVRDEDASAAEGIPVYREMPYIEVRIPDDRDYLSRPVTDDDRRNYPAAWAAYESRGADPLHLRSLRMGPARFMELAERNVHTVEQLAAYTDALPPNLESFRLAARRVLTALKPRYAIIDGEMKETQ